MTACPAAVCAALGSDRIDSGIPAIVYQANRARYPTAAQTALVSSARRAAQRCGPNDCITKAIGSGSAIAGTARMRNAQTRSKGIEVFHHALSRLRVGQRAATGGKVVLHVVRA